jgi:hypothetical protein
MITETFAPVNFPIDGPEIGLMIIFKDITPIYMKVNFLKWCEIGLNEIGGSRQLERMVIKHVEIEFIGLLNAVYYTAGAMADEERMDDYLNQYLENYYKKKAKKKEVLLPFNFCIAFFNGITRESAKSILWLLMEVVSANKDKYEYQLEQKDILNLYERYSAVIDIGYDWAKFIKKKEHAEKKSASKKNKKRKR